MNVAIEFDQLFVRRPRAIRVFPFTEDMADSKLLNEDGTAAICYIHTREGKRIIDESMMMAIKSDSYRHPMDPQVLSHEYVSLAAYDSAFACELKDQIASHLIKALESDDVTGNIRAIADMLKQSATSASLSAEHSE